MALYELRYLDAVRRLIVIRRSFEAESDELAVIHAEDARGLAPMELWQGERKIREWDAFPPTG